METEKKIERLREEINRHNYNYYVLAEPEITDEEYDLLLKELEELEKNNPRLITPDSPTQRVGSDLTKKFNSRTHRVPMLSLSNTYNEEELYDFDRRIRDSLPSGEVIEYVAELKIDGASVSLTYRDGYLIAAATRGDGSTGEEITPNVRTIKSVPLKLRKKEIEGYLLDDIEVRGEVFMEKKAFLRLNEEREKRGEKVFANPRNSTAGTLKLQDPSIVASRPLDIFVYYLIPAEGEFISQFENLRILKEAGFKVNPWSKLFHSIEEVITFCRETESKRDEIPYDIDGVVIKVNSVKQQSILGNIARSPRWATSFKFSARKAETTINDIIWQVGRTGAVTPVAVLQPVSLSGSVISRATLHNMDEIVRKDIRIGDRVVIEKGGDVIPKVTEVVDSGRIDRGLVTKPPEKCPVCSSVLVSPEEEVGIFCENHLCPARLKGALSHFASRNAMDIEGLGEAIIDLLVDRGYIKSFPDIYHLYSKKEELERIERFGEKSIGNLLVAIENSKLKPYEKVLFALGIRFVGEGVATLLAENFPSIDGLADALAEEIESVYGIGPRISESVTEFFRIGKNREMIGELKKAGLSFEAEQKADKTDSLKGKVFVLTGTLLQMTRGEAKDKILLAGGKASSSVSRNTDFVVAGEKAGSKLKKANELGIKVISEDEFLNIING